MVTISFEKHTLSNGLDVILHEDHNIPVVAVNVWYHVGSKDEEIGRTGFAHLFEHVMFEGSKHHNSSHFDPLQKAGANLNGSTTPDRTNYWEDVPTNYLDLKGVTWLERYLTNMPSIWMEDTLPLGFIELGMAAGWLGGHVHSLTRTERIGHTPAGFGGGLINHADLKKARHLKNTGGPRSHVACNDAGQTVQHSFYIFALHASVFSNRVHEVSLGKGA
jgi:hypothetical protein